MDYKVDIDCRDDGYVYLSATTVANLTAWAQKVKATKLEIDLQLMTMERDKAEFEVKKMKREQKISKLNHDFRGVEERLRAFQSSLSNQLNIPLGELSYDDTTGRLSRVSSDGPAHPLTVHTLDKMTRPAATGEAKAKLR